MSSAEDVKCDPKCCRRQDIAKLVTLHGVCFVVDLCRSYFQSKHKAPNIFLSVDSSDAYDSHDSFNGGLLALYSNRSAFVLPATLLTTLSTYFWRENWFLLPLDWPNCQLQTQVKKFLLPNRYYWRKIEDENLKFKNVIFGYFGTVIYLSKIEHIFSLATRSAVGEKTWPTNTAFVFDIFSIRTS